MIGGNQRHCTLGLSGSAVMECASHQLRKETHISTAMRFDVIPGGTSRQCIHITAAADVGHVAWSHTTTAHVSHTVWSPLCWGMSSSDGVCGLLAFGYHFLSRQ